MRIKRHKTRNVEDVCKRAAAIVDSQPRPTILVKPESAAKNPLEEAAALFLQSIKPNYLASYAFPGQREFMFRCVYVPLFCKTVIAWDVKQEGNPKYWLWQHGTYLLAHERMLMEMHARKAIKLEGGLLDALADPALDYRYWLKRFDQWRDAAEASYRYFIEKQSPHIEKSAQPQAAHLGTIQNLADGQLPAELFAGMLARIHADVVAAAAFTKTADRIKAARWAEPALDTWLIEIWPLVTEYGWNYYDVWGMANDKWKELDSGSCKTVAMVSDRCKKMLGLKLSGRGGAKQGRPKSVGEFKPAALAPLAIWIRSVGDDEEEWIRGQF